MPSELQPVGSRDNLREENRRSRLMKMFDACTEDGQAATVAAGGPEESSTPAQALTRVRRPTPVVESERPGRTRGPQVSVTPRPPRSPGAHIPSAWPDIEARRVSRSHRFRKIGSPAIVTPRMPKSLPEYVGGVIDDHVNTLNAFDALLKASALVPASDVDEKPPATRPRFTSTFSVPPEVDASNSVRWVLPESLRVHVKKIADAFPKHSVVGSGEVQHRFEFHPSDHYCSSAL